MKKEIIINSTTHEVRIAMLEDSELVEMLVESADAKRIVGNVAANHAEAEQWDLEFWQKAGAAARLSALVAIRNDIMAVRGRDKREDLERIPDRNKAFDDE